MLQESRLFADAIAEFCAVDGAGRPEATAAVERAIYDDVEINVRSVQARAELMRGDLLNGGDLSFLHYAVRHESPVFLFIE